MSNEFRGLLGQIETKSSSGFEFSEDQLNENEFTGYVAIFDNVDSDGDIIRRGAFKKTLAEKTPKNKIIGLWQHDMYGNPFSMPIRLEEDSKGLFVHAKIVPTTENINERKPHLIAGSVSEMSFGYRPIEGKTRRDDDTGVREIFELEMFEFSPVVWGANSSTSIESAKRLKMKTKRVSGDTSLPISDRDVSWDGSEARKRILEWAGGDPSSAKYRKAFFWYDDENPENVGSYKLPFADVIDGELTIVPRGVSAAKGSLSGSRGNKPDIPEQDFDPILEKIRKIEDRIKDEKSLIIHLTDSQFLIVSKALHAKKEPDLSTLVDTMEPHKDNVDPDDFQSALRILRSI